MRITPENITELEPDEIFVFGSNLAGRHGKGAAKIAVDKFGARYGCGSGWYGQTYAIPTKDQNLSKLRLFQIGIYVNGFLTFAEMFPKKTFKVTKIGTGLAGYSVADIAPMFKRAIQMENVHLPIEFWEFLINNKETK